MFKRINFNDFLQTNYISETDIKFRVEYGEKDEFLSKNSSEYQYIDCILDRSNNPVNITTEVKRLMNTLKVYDRVETYKDMLKDAVCGTYILARVEKGYDSIIKFNVYDISYIDIHQNRYDNIPVLIINLKPSAYDYEFTEKFLQRLPIKDDSRAFYYNILKKALDIKIHGVEYVAKDIKSSFFDSESDYLSTILGLKNGKLKSEKGPERIYISNNKICMINDIIIINGEMFNMIDLRELYSIVSINKEDGTLSLTYSDKHNKYTDSIETMITCERNSIARDCMKRFVDVCKEEN